MPRGPKLIWTLAIQRFKVVSGGMSMIACAVDGSHIELAMKPNKMDTPANYWSRYDCYAVVLQVVCDADCIINDINCSWPARNHDTAIFRRSNVFKSLKNKQVVRDHSDGIGGVTVYPLIVGDSAYLAIVFQYESIP
jgi:hypothetical protein